MEAVDGGESVVEGGIYLRFPYFFCFFVFWVPNRRPKPGKYRPITDLHCEPIFCLLDDYSRLAIPLDDCSRLARDKG